MKLWAPELKPDSPLRVDVSGTPRQRTTADGGGVWIRAGRGADGAWVPLRPCNDSVCVDREHIPWEYPAVHSSARLDLNAQTQHHPPCIQTEVVAQQNETISIGPRLCPVARHRRPAAPRLAQPTNVVVTGHRAQGAVHALHCTATLQALTPPASATTRFPHKDPTPKKVQSLVIGLA